MAETLYIEVVHEVARDVVVHRPQSHDDAVHAGHPKGAFEAQHAFAVLQNAVAGVACGEYCPVHSAQIERRDLLRGEYRGFASLIHAGKDEARVEKWIAVSAALVEHESVRGHMQHAMPRRLIEEPRAGRIGAGDE